MELAGAFGEIKSSDEHNGPVTLPSGMGPPLPGAGLCVEKGKVQNVWVAHRSFQNMAAIL